MNGPGLGDVLPSVTAALGVPVRGPARLAAVAFARAVSAATAGV